MMSPMPFVVRVYLQSVELVVGTMTPLRDGSVVWAPTDAAEASPETASAIAKTFIAVSSV
jgi:hypothetical protein